MQVENRGLQALEQISAGVLNNDGSGATKRQIQMHLFNLFAMPCFLSKTDLDRLPRQAPDNDQEIKLTITTGGRFLFAQGIQAKTFPSLFRLTPPRSSSRVSSCRCASTSSNSTQVRKCIISFAAMHFIFVGLLKMPSFYQDMLGTNINR
eukprot:COSAG06_NODE_414_length_16033_cov_67.366717_8_plen_150_part_00